MFKPPFLGTPLLPLRHTAPDLILGTDLDVARLHRHQAITYYDMLSYVILQSTIMYYNILYYNILLYIIIHFIMLYVL